MLLTSTFYQYTTTSKVILGLLFFVIALMFLHYTIKMIEMSYVLKYKKPLYNHFYLFLRKLNQKQLYILETQFLFYKKLNDKQKKYFEHRVVQFIKDKEFTGRSELKIDEQKKVLTSATAVMLTFGFRDFYIGSIDKIFLYPSDFYSVSNQNYHKGEFNPKLKVLALAWDHFEQGFDIKEDKINLGIHEFVHAIHFNAIKERDVSSTIFIDSFKELTKMLTADDGLREDLVSSNYFRPYGYTNQFEFIAVIIESFIESPLEFHSQFPSIYDKVKQMLNFNFAGY